MPNKQDHDAFLQFMVDYTAFLGQMRADESEKMAALASRQLPRIEQSIATSQANAKKLENFEKKRMELQTAAGYGGLSFRQLIDVAPLDTQEQLWQLFTRFEGNVAEIRFYNDKSMAIARDNMIDIDPSAVLAGPPGAKQGAKPQNPYERIREEQSKQDSMILEKKA